MESVTEACMWSGQGEQNLSKVPTLDGRAQLTAVDTIIETMYYAHACARVTSRAADMRLRLALAAKPSVK